MSEFARGKQVGHYRLVRLLGTGGFAEVYLGVHVHLQTSAAVKILHMQLQAQGLEQFRNEARAIARFKHPHIVRVLDFGLDGQTPYLVMEYLPLGTVRQLYAPGTQLPLSTVILYARQIAEALQYAHDARYIHRDVKPDNMLVEKISHLLLSDFSLAVTAHSTRSQTALPIAGTIGYMAPEQIEEYPRPASDRYALGVVVYEWLCGRRPFHGTVLEVIAKHCSVPPPALRAHNPALSPDVERVVLRALEKEWQARFPTIREFAQALEQAACAPATGRVAASASSASARPGPSAHPPGGPAMSVGKQAWWMVSYLLLALVCWASYFVGFLADALRKTAETAAPIPLQVYLLLLCILVVPVSVLLAGTIFGGWRAGVVTLLYTAVIAFLVAAPLLFWGRVVGTPTVLAYAGLFCTWPLAALVTGTLLPRRLLRGFMYTYPTILLGMLIMVAGFAPLILVEEAPSAPSTDLATTALLLLFAVPLVAGLLALPVTFIDLVVRRSLDRGRERRVAGAGGF